MSVGPVLIMAGGTGGHIYPALAVAGELQSRGVDVIWLGTRKGMEAKIVPKHGIRMEWLRIAGLRGKGVLTWLWAPFKLALACLQAGLILRRVKPSVVLGMGGFVSGPGGIVASALKIPLLIHEQNALPGLTNRRLATRADRVLEAFPGTFSGTLNPLCVGNPVRPEIVAIAPPAERLHLDQQPLRVLVLGGSQGASCLNEVLPQALAKVMPGRSLQVRHQCGRAHVQATISAYRAVDVEAQIEAFIEDMAHAYRWADVLICRAGAMTIAEIAVVGVASILVPYPYAVDDHQTVNAEYLVSKEAAILMPQSVLSADALAAEIETFADNRQAVLAMAQSARALGQPEAAARVVAEIMPLRAAA